MFEFNPELVEGDDVEADEAAYQRELRDDDDVCTHCTAHSIVIVSSRLSLVIIALLVEIVIINNSACQSRPYDHAACTTHLSLFLFVIFIALVVVVNDIHFMNAELNQAQLSANLWTKPVSLSHLSTLTGSYIVHHLLVLSMKADAHFNIPWKVEG